MAVRELRVPTRPVTVDVFTTDGAVTHGYLYHAASAYESGSACDIAAELNDERHFVPFHHEEENGGVFLLNKQHILRVSTDELSFTDLGCLAAVEAEDVDSCTLWMADGSHLPCRPFVETRAVSSRLIDKLNHAPTFMTVVTDDGVQFVRADQIVRIVGDR